MDATRIGRACRGVMAVRALCAVSVAVMSARPAGAQPNELAWQAPASCPDAASVRDRIEQRLGRSLDDAVVGISVEIAPSGGRFVARLDLRAVTVADDVRTLTSARCDELADAVAVIVARVARDVAHRPVRVATREEPLVTLHTTRDEPAPRRVWSVGVRLSAVSGIGVVPEVGLGGELAVSVRRRSAMAELAKTRWFASPAQVLANAPAHVDIGLDVTAARVGWRSEQLPLRGWLSGEVGTMSGAGVALANPQVGSGRWVALGAGFGVAWQMTRWIRLVGTTEVLAAFERVRFSLADGAVVYAPSPLSARTTCGLELGWQ